jgi:hypothetical protein
MILHFRLHSYNGTEREKKSKIDSVNVSMAFPVLTMNYSLSEKLSTETATVTNYFSWKNSSVRGATSIKSFLGFNEKFRLGSDFVEKVFVWGEKKQRTNFTLKRLKLLDDFDSLSYRFPSTFDVPDRTDPT